MSELTPEAIDALPVGSKVYDCDGDELTRIEGGWMYSDVLAGPNPRLMTIRVPEMWAPYSLVPPVDPADPDYNPRRHARR